MKGASQFNSEIAQRYAIPLDRKLYCDDPLVELFGDLSAKAIIDIGCGNGLLSRRFAQKAARVVGVDISPEMLDQARALNGDLTNTEFKVGDVQGLPCADEEFDGAVCSMTINTFANSQLVTGLFTESARVLKPKGIFAVSLPHPLTLDQKTPFRWTEWKPGQTQKNLKQGEAITRKIMGKNGEMLTVVNNYWPPQVLTDCANKCGLTHLQTIEAKATDQDLKKYPILDPKLKETSFFLVMGFQKV